MAESTMSLEASVEATLSALRDDQWRAAQSFTIFRVPAYVRESSRNSYEPRMVSIGPYYHDGAALRAMEDHKWRYLQDLLYREGPVVTASGLVAEMRALEARARACYSERPARFASDDFVRMLLLDGCFILEFFFKWHTREADALCDIGWGLTTVAADLLLMENQIPFFVLERLYGVIAGEQGGRESLLNLFVEYIEEGDPIRRPSADLEVNHLLHLYYECYVPKRPAKQATIMQIIPEAGVTFVKHKVALPRLYDCFVPKRTPPLTRTIPRATELLEAGVTFVLATAPRDSYDVTFDRRRGVMRIPVIEIDDIKRHLLINLIAFEQTLGCEEPHILTSYVVLMSNLIVTTRDVELLRRRRILESLLADDDEAARFFSRLGEGGAINYKLQTFSRLYDDVRRYCDSPWHRYRVALHRDYFSSPWSVISLVVAAFVIALAATQTYFTVFPAKK
ncbi:hypothetical protein E2562_023132 [Oryza meyeriana var. granulata]|uniref:Uncharacterized protein n=1 Tax=Oryza meyeriana var. granulata TaxID=110450 RepID=A0A6G1E0H0_9ORYZ|nr:hypothetical protein E2562_023132 [Oryza meyeriana var. granulata]